MRFFASKRALVWVSLALSLGPGVARSETSEIAELVIVGELSLEEKIEETTTGFRVSGHVNDELGVPREGVRLDVPGARLLPCDEPSTEPRASDLTTGAAGEFCFAIEAARNDRIRVRARAEHHGELVREIVLRSPGDAPPRFVRAPAIVDRSSGTREVIDVLVPLGPDERTEGRLELSLEVNGRHFAIEQRTAHGGELVHFEVPSASFADVGAGALSVSFSSPSGTTRSSPRALDVRSRVALSLARVEPSSKGVAVELDVTAAGGPATSGLVELRDDRGEFLGSADVNAGHAHLVLDRQAKSRPVFARYSSASPHLFAGDPLPFELPASRFVFLPWLVQGAFASLLVVWLVLLWRRAERVRPLSETIAPPGRALVARPRGARSRGPSRGVVRDAHTGAVVAGARVALVEPTATAERTVGSTSSDEHGRFELPEDASGVARLVVTSPHHMRLEAPALRGDVEIHVTHRRHAGLLALLEWARRPGSPWSKSAVPTPRAIELDARERNAEEDAVWAARVGRTVYGPEAPEEEEIRELRRASEVRSVR